MKKTLNFKFVILALAFLAGLTIGGVILWRQHTVVTVGDFKITNEDLQLRYKIINYEYGRAKIETARQQLIEIYLMAQILKNGQIEINNDMILQEEHKMEADPREAKKLQAIKNLFSDDAKVEKIYVMPLLAKRLIFDMFLKDPKAQENSLDRAHFTDWLTFEKSRIKIIN